MSLDKKILLITGGTGSFGNALLDKVLDSDIKEIRIFSRDEKKQEDMRKKYNNSKIKFFIGDVRDSGSLKDALHDVDYVFHAAALKQVPSCEFFPLEAVKTNIIGTDNVLNMSINSGVSKIICLSTDKAVYPVNAMGTSKAMMEKVFIAKSMVVNQNQTKICGTRYGNVMASRGSVIPLFISQIMDHKPLTITNPDMTRYIMTLDEAVDLVLYAFENAENGDIMVQKAPACTIGDLAEALKQLFKSNSEILIIGKRHGEKMYESLLTEEECQVAIDFGEYFKIPADKRDLNYGKYFDEGIKNKMIYNEYTSHSTERLNINQIKDKLLQLEYVREYLKKMSEGI